MWWRLGVADYTITGWTKLGGLIRDARQAQAITQADLARRAGVARSWLARVEAGHRGAELEPLLRLLDALGMTMTLTAPPGPHAPTSTTERAPALTSFESVPGPAGTALREAATARRAAWGLAQPSEGSHD